MRKLFNILFSIAALVAAMSFKPATKTHTLTIHFENVVDGKPLVLDSVTYTNALKQPFTVSKFKFYIGSINIATNDGNAVSIGKAYLINEEDPQSKDISINLFDIDTIEDISLTVGIDSARSCSGAQTGALDPVNAMFWAWNTGYVFVKMEGRSPLSTQPGHLLEFHIGGYRTPYNCIRDIPVPLKKELSFDKDGKASITIQVNVAELFKTPTAIDFSKLSSVTDFHNATTIADNYTDMFSIK
jgi:hypothetical protein